MCYFALEAEPKEIERRTKYAFVVELAIQARDPAAAREAIGAHMAYVEQAFHDQMRADKHEAIARQRLEQEASR